LNLIAPALIIAQTKMVNPKMDSKNPHFGNAYASLGVSLKAAQDALNPQGIVIVQMFAPAPVGVVAVTTLLIHKSGQYIGGTASVPLDRDNAQGYGSATTYAKRYGVQSIMGMVAEEDEDGNIASAPAKTKTSKGIFY
jgi:hypothetical protein